MISLDKSAENLTLRNCDIKIITCSEKAQYVTKNLWIAIEKIFPRVLIVEKVSFV